MRLLKTLTFDTLTMQVNFRLTMSVGWLQIPSNSQNRQNRQNHGFPDPVHQATKFNNAEMRHSESVLRSATAPKEAFQEQRGSVGRTEAGPRQLAEFRRCNRSGGSMAARGPHSVRPQQARRRPLVCSAGNWLRHACAEKTDLEMTDGRMSRQDLKRL